MKVTDPLFIVNSRKSLHFLLVASKGNDARANTLYTQYTYTMEDIWGVRFHVFKNREREERT
jgi:hypothetical protein